MTTTVKQRLLEAARIMREKGLAKFSFQDGDGKVCMLRAMTLACIDEDVEWHQEELNVMDRLGVRCAVVKALRDSGARTVDPMLWSDLDARDAEEVARMFERAAEGVS